MPSHPVLCVMAGGACGGLVTRGMSDCAGAPDQACPRSSCLVGRHDHCLVGTCLKAVPVADAGLKPRSLDDTLRRVATCAQWKSRLNLA